MRAALVLAAVFIATPIAAAELAPPEALIDKHAESFNHADAEAVAALYADDGKVFTSEGRVIRGRRDIAKFWALELSRQPRSLRMTTSEKEASGDVAFAIGGYSLTGKPAERGTFTICMKRGADGSWKIVASMWNENWSFGYTPLQ